MADVRVTMRDARYKEIMREHETARARASVGAGWANIVRMGHGTVRDYIPTKDKAGDIALASRIIHDGAWAGHRAFVVAGGPSLRDFDFSRLVGELVIGVNRAFEVVDCQVLCSMDSRFHDWIVSGTLGQDARRKFADFQGVKLWVALGSRELPGVYYVHNAGHLGVSRSMKEGLYHGNNSGYAGLNLAIALGADPIYLLGFDGKYGTGGAAHWHGDYPVKENERTITRYGENFSTIASGVNGQGPRIINLNPDSAIRCFEFARFEDLPPIRRPVAVTFWTNEGYRAEAKNLIASCRRFNIEIDARQLEDRGGWQANNQAKPEFILEAMDRHPGRPILWLDADAVFRAQPFLFEQIAGTDFAGHWRNGTELLGSCLYFENNASGRRLLRLWIEENGAHDPERFDQANLDDAIKKWEGSIFRLPPQYCQIFDIMADVEDPVITQYQASRRLRKTAGAPVKIGDRSAGLVSIMMPAWNVEKYVDQAIRSCLAQTYKNIEIIVVDDGSSDGTAERVSELAATDDRVRLIAHERNLGEAAARNTALKHCRGEFIARMDADDWDDPTRIEKSLARLRSSPAVDAVSCQMTVIRGQDRTIPRDCERGMVPDLWMNGRRGGDPVNASIIARREIYDIIGPFDMDLRVGTDSDWDARACLAGARWGFVNEPLYFYRKYDGQLTSAIDETSRRAFLEHCGQIYKPAWNADYNPARQFEIFVTGRCTRDCAWCSQGTFRRGSRDYSMDTDELGALIARLREVNAGYLWLEWTGGEPSLWPLLERGLSEAKTAAVCQKNRIFTNMARPDALERVMDSGAADQLYVARYPGNGPDIERFKAKYGDRIIVEAYAHKPLPAAPLENVLPAECNCDRATYLRGTVMPCGNAYEHIVRFGHRFSDYPGSSVDVNQDWISAFRKVDKTSFPFCRVCLANGKVWRRIPEQTEAEVNT